MSFYIISVQSYKFGVSDSFYDSPMVAVAFAKCVVAIRIHIGWTLIFPVIVAIIAATCIKFLVIG